MNLDYQVFQWINQFAGKVPLLDHVTVVYSKFGPLLFGAVLAWLWFFRKGDKAELRQTVLLAVTAAGVALAINQLIGAVYFRPRPFADHVVTLLLNRSADPSFPSDHATGSFALALTVFWKDRKAGSVMLMMAFLLGWSRIFTGTHYPLDVIGGALTGGLGMLAVKWQSRRLQSMNKWLLGHWAKVVWKQ